MGVTTPLLTRRHTGDDRRGNRRLTRWDVTRIRRWAQTTGSDLTMGGQIETIRSWPSYAMMSEAAIRDILLNNAWHDPAYVPGATAQAVQTLPSSLTFLCVLLFLWRSSCGGSCDGSFDAMIHRIGISR